MGKITPALSKAVGWDPQNVIYPTLEQVNKASDLELLTWYRFLHSPVDEEQIKVMDRIFQRVQEEDPS